MSRKLFVSTVAILFVLIGTLAFSLVGAAVPQAAGAEDEGTTTLPRTVTVIGQGTASAAPDQAVLNVGVQTTGATVKEAMADNNEIMDAILTSLDEMEIESKDIQTTNFSIYFERTPSIAMASDRMVQEGPSMEGAYRVSNMVQVTIRDLDEVSTVLDNVVEAGANNIWGVNFTISDPDALEDEARVKSVADARERAEELAELHGVSLGQVVTISEAIGGGIGVPMFEASRAMSAGFGGGGAPVEPGELEFTFSIQVTYEIQ